MEKTSQHKILSYMNSRGMLKDQTLERKLSNLNSGYAGELEFIEWFERYRPSNWWLVTDYWFDMGSRMQIDDLLISNQRWIVVDVKNYHGVFRYEKGVCSLNGYAFDNDIFASLEMKTVRIRKMVAGIHPDIQVDSAMIFIGEHCQVELDCVPKAQVVLRNQLKQFLESLEYTDPLPQWLQNKIDHQLAFYRTDPRPPDVALVPEQFAGLQKGICCEGCGRYDVEVGKKWVRCLTCGAEQSIGQAVCRLAVEIRYLFYYYPKMVTTANVYELCGRRLSHRTIRKYLTQEFKVSHRGIGSYYEITDIK